MKHYALGLLIIGSFSSLSHAAENAAVEDQGGGQLALLVQRLDALEKENTALKAKMERCVTPTKLGNYATTDALGNYAQKGDVPSLDGLARQDELERVREEVGKKALASELEKFVTADALTGYARTDALENFVTSDALSKYATTDSLGEDHPTAEEFAEVARLAVVVALEKGNYVQAGEDSFDTLFEQQLGQSSVVKVAALEAVLGDLATKEEVSGVSDQLRDFVEQADGDEERSVVRKGALANIITNHIKQLMGIEALSAVVRTEDDIQPALEEDAGPAPEFDFLSALGALLPLGDGTKETLGLDGDGSEALLASLRSKLTDEVVDLADEALEKKLKQLLGIAEDADLPEGLYQVLGAVKDMHRSCLGRGYRKITSCCKKSGDTALVSKVKSQSTAI